MTQDLKIEYSENPLSMFVSIRNMPKMQRRGAEQVCRRTGLKCLFNPKSGIVHFYRQTPWYGVAQSESRYIGRQDEIDHVVRTVWYARRDSAEKNREVDRSQKDSEYQAEKRLDTMIEARSGSVADKANHVIDKAKMGSHWKGSAVVNGTKE